MSAPIAKQTARTADSEAQGTDIVCAVKTCKKAAVMELAIVGVPKVDAGWYPVCLEHSRCWAARRNLKTKKPLTEAELSAINRGKSPNEKGQR